MLVVEGCNPWPKRCIVRSTPGGLPPSLRDFRALIEPTAYAAGGKGSDAFFNSPGPFFSYAQRCEDALTAPRRRPGTLTPLRGTGAYESGLEARGLQLPLFTELPGRLILGKWASAK